MNGRKAADRQSVCYLSFHNSSICVFCFQTYLTLFFESVRCIHVAKYHTNKQSCIAEAKSYN